MVGLVRMVLLSAAAVLLVVLLTVVVVLRRGGRTGEDLLASQLRSMADPEPHRSPGSATATLTWGDHNPSSDQPAASDPSTRIDDATWRRIEELVTAGR